MINVFLIAAYPNVIADVNAKFITLKNVGFVPFITPVGFTNLVILLLMVKK